ncbi:protein FAM162B-like [Rhinophrynus dorsalis]
MSTFNVMRFQSLARNMYNAGCKAIQGRPYCQAVKELKPSYNTQFTGQHLFRNQKKPTNFDKKVLLWSGRFKKQEEIPEYISCEVLSAARNNVRIKTCYAMIAGTIIGCIAMVISGKKAQKEDNTLIQKNMERKAKWREEAMREQATLKSQ